MRNLFLILSLLLVAPLAADDVPEPKIEDLRAVASAGKVSVSFRLVNAFRDEEALEGLRNGAPTAFRYIVEIFRDRPNWFDDGLAESRLEVICTFNSLTREYLLNYRRDRKLVRTETFTDLESLERRMTSIEERDLFEIGGRRAYKLKVRVKADLARGWLLYVIPWNASTRWRETRVKTAEAP